MKICVISNLYPPNMRGGAERIAAITVEEMQRQGHEVVVVTASQDGQVGETREDGVRRMSIDPRLPYALLQDSAQPLLKRLRWHAADLLSGASARAVQEILETEKPDLVVTHNLRGIGLRLARVLGRHGVHWTHVLHDIQLLVPSGQFVYGGGAVWQRSFVTRPYQWWTRRLMGSPSHVIAPTKSILDAHQSRGFFKGSQMLQLVNPVGEVSVSHRGGDGTTLLFVGQLELMKGVEVLFRALKRMPEGQSFTLHVVGEGSLRTELMEMVLALPDQHTVVFHGRVPHEEVLALMAQSDGFVFPSVSVENCPGVLLEARAVGVPIVASDVGGVSELVDASGLVPPNDEKRLAMGLFDLLQGRVRATTGYSQLTLSEYVHAVLQK